MFYFAEAIAEFSLPSSAIKSTARKPISPKDGESYFLNNLSELISILRKRFRYIFAIRSIHQETYLSEIKLDHVDISLSEKDVLQLH